jgi:hypothetical protein
MSKAGVWREGDRVFNRATGKQGTVSGVDSSVVISIDGDGIVLGKQAALEVLGWQLDGRSLDGE